MGEVEVVYKEMKIAQDALAETYKRVEPRLKAIQEKRDSLRKQSQFCLMMAMLCFAAPILIVVAVGGYRMLAGQ